MKMVTPELTSSMAEKLDESPDAVRKGMQAGAATLLASLANKAAESSSFLQQLFGMVNQPGAGSQLMTAAFGTHVQQTTIATLVGQSAKIKGSSASTLLEMAAPMVLGILGKETSASSLESTLSAELPGLGKFLPAGIGSVIGGAGASTVTAHADAHGDAHEPEPVKGGGGWVLPALVGLILLGALTWWYLRGSDTATPPPAQTAEAATTEAPKNLWPALGEFGKRKLADGTELSIPKLGVENRLIDFIEDSSKKVDKETWFDFDRLLFDTGNATLQPASQAQLADIAAILKAYPKVKMRIGGYTDNVGDKAANMTLSQARASNVAAELEKLGVDKSRLDSKGYGEDHPVAPNDTDEGRAKNRRISMRVMEK
ncbi:MAG TPA: OmpA family protein [Bryobacteraceae bacterium]|jgi:outer membrane protein OmpA-like peptidoglycan-associated protein